MRATTEPPQLALALLIAAITAALFWPATGYAFLNFDDDVYVTENAVVARGLSPEGIAWAFTTFHSGNWHPLTWLSHMADASIFGLDPRGHHRTSILLHAANAALVFLLLDRMTRARWRSAAAAALFAVHPLRIESVAWIAERKDVLSACFGLLALLSYVAWTSRPEPKRYAALLSIYTLSLMSKPMLVTLPALLLILDAWPLERLSRTTLPERVREKLPLVALALTSAVVTFLAQRAEGAVVSIERFSIGVRLENALVAAVTYLVRSVWPAGLAVFYPHPGPSIPAATLAGALVLAGAVGFAAYRLRRPAPYLAAGLGWFAVSLLPVIGLVQVGGQAMADRYTYLPSIGLAIAAAWGAWALVPSTTARAALACASILALSLATRTQLAYWKDSESLFTRALAVTSRNYPAQINLGILLRNRGRLDDAIGHFREATAISPSYWRAWYHLGMGLDRAGRAEEAVAAYRKALELNPENAETHFDLGVVYAAQGRPDDAIGQFAEAARLNPALARAYYNWGSVLVTQSRWDEAIVQFTRAIAVDPRYAEAHYNLGAAALMKGDRETARREIGTARAQGYEPPPQVLEMLALPR